tara:strand:+ start:689 stop:823 length:135 start_codon:yes stop_codon:yes gene_type:complete
MSTKGERREQKRNKKWYQKAYKNNRKALEVILDAIRRRNSNAAS